QTAGVRRIEIAQAKSLAAADAEGLHVSLEAIEDGGSRHAIGVRRSGRRVHVAQLHRRLTLRVAVSTASGVPALTSSSLAASQRAAAASLSCRTDATAC